MSKAQEKEQVGKINDAIPPKETNDRLIEQQDNPEKVPLIEVEGIKTQPAHYKTAKLQSKRHRERVKEDHQCTSKTKIKITQSESKKGQADGRLTEKFQINLGNIKLKLKEKDPKGRSSPGSGRQLKNPQTQSEKQEKKIAKQGQQTQRKEEERIQEIMNHIKPYIEQIQRITKRKKMMIKGEQNKSIKNQQSIKEEKGSNVKKKSQCIQMQKQGDKQGDKKEKERDKIKQDIKEYNQMNEIKVKEVKQVPSEAKHAQVVPILPQKPLKEVKQVPSEAKHAQVVPILPQKPLKEVKQVPSEAKHAQVVPILPQKPLKEVKQVPSEAKHAQVVPILPQKPLKEVKQVPSEAKHAQVVPILPQKPLKEVKQVPSEAKHAQVVPILPQKPLKEVKQVPSEAKHAQVVPILPKNPAPTIALPISLTTFCSYSLVIPNLHEQSFPFQNKQTFLSQSLPSRLKPLFSQRLCVDSDIISFSSLQAFQFPSLPLIPPTPFSSRKSPKPIYSQHPVQLSSNVFNISIGQILHPNYTSQARMLLSEISQLKGKISSLEKRRVAKRVVSPKNRYRSIERVESNGRAQNLSYTFTKIPQTPEGSATIHFPSTHQNPSTPVGVDRSRKSFRLKSHKRAAQSLNKEPLTGNFTIAKPYPRRLNFQTNFRQQTKAFFSWYKPSLPNPQWSQQQLLISARRLFKMLGEDIDTSGQPPLRINKYKNCLSFVLDRMKTILWYYSGRFYYGGCSQDGVKEGWGFDYYPERYVYSGDFASNQRNSNGVMKHLGADQGIVYEGEWRENQKHGIGRQIQASGEEYIGEWVHGEKKGRGWMKTEHSSLFQVKIEHDFNAVDLERGYQNNPRALRNKEKYKKTVGNSALVQKSGEGPIIKSKDN